VYFIITRHFYFGEEQTENIWASGDENLGIFLLWPYLSLPHGNIPNTSPSFHKFSIRVILSIKVEIWRKS
jgi:hypothetical protein